MHTFYNWATGQSALFYQCSYRRLRTQCTHAVHITELGFEEDILRQIKRAVFVNLMQCISVSDALRTIILGTICAIFEREAVYLMVSWIMNEKWLGVSVRESFLSHMGFGKCLEVSIWPNEDYYFKEIYFNAFISSYFARAAKSCAMFWRPFPIQRTFLRTCLAIVS